MAGLQHRKIEARIYKALQMPLSISGAKTSTKWLTLLLFGVRGRRTFPHPCRGPAQAQHASASIHTCLQLKASLHGAYTQLHRPPPELTKPSPWSKAGREPQLLLPWSITVESPIPSSHNPSSAQCPHSPVPLPAEVHPAS